MNKPFPTLPEFLCICLFMGFVLGLVYMGFNAPRKPSSHVSATMQTDMDPPVQPIRLEVCVTTDC